MSLISRSDRGLLARWWFTVDRPLLSATLLLMAVGVLVSMAASPPVASRIGLDAYHFVKSQLFYLSLAVVGLLTISCFDRQWVRRAGLLGFVGSLFLMWLALKFVRKSREPIAGLMLAPSACNRRSLPNPVLSSYLPGCCLSAFDYLTCRVI